MGHVVSAPTPEYPYDHINHKGIRETISEHGTYKLLFEKPINIKCRRLNPIEMFPVTCYPLLCTLSSIRLSFSARCIDPSGKAPIIYLELIKKNDFTVFKQEICEFPTNPELQEIHKHIDGTSLLITSTEPGDVVRIAFTLNQKQEIHIEKFSLTFHGIQSVLPIHQTIEEKISEDNEFVLFSPIPWHWHGTPGDQHVSWIGCPPLTCKCKSIKLSLHCKFNFDALIGAANHYAREHFTATFYIRLIRQQMIVGEAEIFTLQGPNEEVTSVDVLITCISEPLLAALVLKNQPGDEFQIIRSVRGHQLGIFCIRKLKLMLISQTDQPCCTPSRKSLPVIFASMSTSQSNLIEDLSAMDADCHFYDGFGILGDVENDLEEIDDFLGYEESGIIDDGHVSIANSFCHPSMKNNNNNNIDNNSQTKYIIYENEEDKFNPHLENKHNQ